MNTEQEKIIKEQEKMKKEQEKMNKKQKNMIRKRIAEIEKMEEEAKFLREKNKNLARERVGLQKRVQFWKNKKPNLTQQKRPEIAHDILKPFFTLAQINLFIRASWQRCRMWSHEDISRALTLKLISRRAYVYLRDQNCSSSRIVYIK